MKRHAYEWQIYVVEVWLNPSILNYALDAIGDSVRLHWFMLSM